MALNAITTIADMQIVPEKFSTYVTEKTTEKSAMVNAGIATGDAVVAQLINGTPAGGRFITIPAWQPLDASTEEDVFGNARRIVETGGSCPRIYHACGDKDFLLERAHETRDFFQSFPGNPFGYVYDEDPGAHTWEFWDEHLKRFLGFLHDYALI